MLDYGRWDWLGRDLALDLANTLPRISPDERLDLLDTPDALAEWLAAQRGRIEAPPPDHDALERFRALRDALRALLAAATRGTALPAEAVEAVNGHARTVPDYPQLDVTDPDAPRAVETTRRLSPAAVAVARISRAAIRLLGSDRRLAVRECPAPGCGWFFEATRPGQVWCTNVCGNRARVARHHARAAADA